jgi:hypothetical protein
MPLASNSTFIAPWLPNNGAAQQLVLTCNPASQALTVHIQLADGSGPDLSIEVQLIGSIPCYYAVPGNSYPGHYTALALSVAVPPSAPAGLRGIQITQTGNGTVMSLPAAVYINGVE